MNGVRSDRTALSSREGAVFRAIFTCCASPRGGGPPVVPAGECLALVQPFCAAMDPVLLWGIRLLLLAFEWAPVTAACSPRPFTALGPGEQTQYCRAWEQHWLTAVRTAWMALKAIVGVAYCSHPALEARIGMVLRCGR